LPFQFHFPLLTSVFLSFFQTTPTAPNRPNDIDIDCATESDILPSLDLYSYLTGPDFLAEVDFLASALQPNCFDDPSYQSMEDVLEL
jgi:hypothetical protein